MPRRSEPPVNLSHPPSAHRHDHEKTKERYIIIVDKRYETFVFPFKHSMEKNGEIQRELYILKR